MTLVETNPEDLKKGHQTAFSELKDFYRDSVWLMIAHSLSVATAVGPNTQKIHSWSSPKLESLRASFDENIQTKKDICESVGLLPDIDDYDSDDTNDADKEFEEVVDQFMSVVDGKSIDE